MTRAEAVRIRGPIGEMFIFCLLSLPLLSEFCNYSVGLAFAEFQRLPKICKEEMQTKYKHENLIMHKYLLTKNQFSLPILLLYTYNCLFWFVAT